MENTKEFLKTEAGKKLLKETRGLVAKWDKSGLLDPANTDKKGRPMAVLLESHSTLVMEDGTRIDYMTEEEKQQKLKSYYGKPKKCKKKLK